MPAGHAVGLPWCVCVWGGGAWKQKAKNHWYIDTSAKNMKNHREEVLPGQRKTNVSTAVEGERPVCPQGWTMACHESQTTSAFKIWLNNHPGLSYSACFPGFYQRAGLSSVFPGALTHFITHMYGR